MHKSILRALLVLVALVATVTAQQPPTPPPVTAAPAAQTPQPDRQIPPVTFKVEINYVEVDAVVTDAQGNFVRTLKKDDFQVFEDGKPQAVTTFSLVDIPIEHADQPLFASTPIEPDVKTNARDFDGRLYLIVLDDLHTAATRSPRVRAAAKQFITRYMGANDLAAVVQTSGRTNAAQEFTGSKRLLVDAVDKFVGDKLRSATLERIDEYNRTRDIRAAGDPVNDPAAFERGYKARQSLDTLKNLADYLAGIRGRRKALVMISEGIDYDITDVFNNRDATNVMEATRDAIAAATRSNVSIYTIDPRGLTSMAEEGIEIGSLPEDTSLGLGQLSLMNELRLSQDSLRVLADETGGFASVNSNDFKTAFNRITQENSSYYVLGYYASNEKRDGRFRKLDVKLTRPGLIVKSRKGYAAARGGRSVSETRRADTMPGAPGAMNDALSSPLQVTGLPLRAFAAPFKGDNAKATVAVALETGADTFKFTEKDGRFTDTLDVAIMAIDKEGKVRASTRAPAAISLSPERKAVVAQYGFRIVAKLDLPPGRYQIRFAARESGTANLGSVFYELDVPEFTKTPMSMSGVVLASTEAARMPTGGEQLKDLMPIVPTAIREFARSEDLGVYAEVYDNLGSTPHKVDIVATVLADDGREVFRAAEERASSEFGGQRGGFGYSGRIALKDFAPGLYVLRVQATARVGKNEGVGREIQFRVK
jgi:VWFA-related protein